MVESSGILQDSCSIEDKSQGGIHSHLQQYESMETVDAPKKWFQFRVDTRDATCLAYGWEHRILSPPEVHRLICFPRSHFFVYKTSRFRFRSKWWSSPRFWARNSTFVRKVSNNSNHGEPWIAAPCFVCDSNLTLWSQYWSNFRKIIIVKFFWLTVSCQKGLTPLAFEYK